MKVKIDSIKRMNVRLLIHKKKNTEIISVYHYNNLYQYNSRSGLLWWGRA